MKKRIAALILLVLLASGCKRLPEMDASYGEEAVAAAAQEIVALANAGDYESICGLIRTDLKASITPEALKDAWGPTMEAAGDFVETGKLSFYGTDDPATGESYATVILSARYAHKQLTYTLSFDHALNVVGLYLK